MKITRRKLIDLGSVLVQAETTFKTPITGKFYYACSKNRELAREEYKLFVEANPFPPQWDEYENKRIAILNEVGESVKAGFASMSNAERDMILNSADTNVMPIEKRELLVAKINELSEANKDLIDEVNEINKRRNEFLDEEDDYPIKTVKLSDIPEIVGANGYAVMQALDPMIVED